MTLQGDRIAAPINLFRRGAILTIMGILLIVVALPPDAIAYRESMSELWVGGNPGLLVQNQSYSTSTKQTLFHTADNVATDTEAFALGSTPDGGLSLSQTAADTVVGTQTGYFTSSATSDLIPPGRIGLGFMGTVIGDPFWTGTFFGSGMIYPQMVPMDSSMLSASPAGTPASVQKIQDGTGAGSNSSLTFEPAIKNDLNVSMGYLNNSSASGPSIASPQNASSQNATGKAAASPAPALKPGDPLYHQQNKPFSAQLSWPSGPVKAARSKVQNMTAFQRFIMNTVGKSTTDKGFTGMTSYPTYITPLEALVPISPFQFINDAMKMTLPGTQLMNRAWPL